MRERDLRAEPRRLRRRRIIAIQTLRLTSAVLLLGLCSVLFLSACEYLGTGPDPCKLVTKAEAEEALRGPVKGPTSHTGQALVVSGTVKACTFVSKDGWLDLAVVDSCEIPQSVKSAPALEGIGDEAYADGMAVIARKNKTCVWVVIGEYKSFLGEEEKLEAKKKIVQNAIARLSH